MRVPFSLFVHTSIFVSDLSAPDAQKALSIANLSKTYRNGRTALKNISFEVEAGDFFALLGRNGAGKSTTIGITCSLVTKTSGTVHVFDADIDREFSRAKSYIGLVPQEINFNQFETPWNIVINHAGYYGVPRKTAMLRAEKYLTQLGLWDHRDNSSRSLSGGMKRKLMIVRALMHEPRMLILDEPTAGIDFETRLSMWEFMTQLNRDGITIILTTHYLEEAEKLCRNVGVIELGEMILDIGMKSLFTHLKKETYILNLSSPVKDLPADLDQTLRVVDSSAIEVDIQRGENLNIVFDQLSQLGLRVSSIQNKANRLETLFMEILKLEAEQMKLSDEKGHS